MHIIKKIARLLWRGSKSFGRFWRDFLIGDTPEIALGVLIILGLAFLLRHNAIAVELITIVLAVMLLTASVWRRAHK